MATQQQNTNPYGALGSKENLDKLLQGFAATQPKTQIPKTAVPTSVTATTGKVGSFSMPTVPTTFVSPINAVAKTAGEKDYIAAQQAKFDQRLALLQQKQTQDQGFLEKLLSNRVDRASVISSAESELDMSRADMLNKINATIKEVDTLNTEYNAEKAKMEEAIAAVEANRAGIVGGPGILDVLVNDVEKKYSVRLNRISADISSKAAIVEAMQGNYTLARQYINDAVDAATAQYRDDLDAMKIFRDMQGDYFDSIDSVYSDAYDAQIEIAQARYDDERKRAQARYEKELKETGLEDNTNITAEAIINQVLDAGGSPSDAALEYATVLEEIGVQVTQEDINRWTQLAQDTQNKRNSGDGSTAVPLTPDQKILEAQRQPVPNISGLSQTGRLRIPQSGTVSGPSLSGLQLDGLQLDNAQGAFSRAATDTFYSEMFGQ